MPAEWPAPGGEPRLDPLATSGAPLLRICLLGGFAVACGERVIPAAAWRLRKAAAVVKLLALAPGGRCHRELLQEHLWPDQMGAAASGSLRYSLHIARRVLAPDAATGRRCLLLQGNMVVLGPEAPPWIDVPAFEAAARLAERVPSPTACQAALALCAGDLLPEDRYEEWSVARRQSLHEQHLTLLQLLARLQVEAGNLAAAEDTYERLVAAEPAYEEAHVALMVLYVRQGRRYWALRQFQLLAAALHRELEAEPGPTARRLYQALLAGHDRDDPDGTLAAS